MYEVFEQLMKEKGVNATDVSRATGIARANFTDWKKGRATPKADKLQLIADYFGVPIERFTGKKKRITARFSTPGSSEDLLVDRKKLVNDVLNALEKNTGVHPDGQRVWYFDDETAKIAQWIADNPEMKAVMYALRDMPPDSARALAETIKLIKGTNIDG